METTLHVFEVHMKCIPHKKLLGVTLRGTPSCRRVNLRGICRFSRAQWDPFRVNLIPSIIRAGRYFCSVFFLLQ